MTTLKNPHEYTPSEGDAQIFAEGGKAAELLFGEKVWLPLYLRLTDMLLYKNGRVKQSYKMNTALNCPDDVTEFIGYFIDKIIKNKVVTGRFFDGYDGEEGSDLILFHTSARIVRGRVSNWMLETGRSRVVCEADRSVDPDDERSQGWDILQAQTGAADSRTRVSTIEELKNAANRHKGITVKLLHKSGHAIDAPMQTAAAQVYLALDKKQDGRDDLEVNLEDNIKPLPPLDKLKEQIESSVKCIDTQIADKIQHLNNHPHTRKKEWNTQTRLISTLVCNGLFKPLKGEQYAELFGVKVDAAHKRISRYWAARNEVIDHQHIGTQLGFEPEEAAMLVGITLDEDE